MAYIGRNPVIGNFVKLDSITVVNGQAAYTMQNGGVNFTSYDNVNQFLVSLNGVLQAPTDSFTVSGSTLTFASNLSTGDVIDFVLVLGNSLDIGTPSDNTVTAAKLNNDIISGQTALATEPADTDEFLVSDAGTLKRIDYSLIKGGGKILQAVSATDSTERSTTSTTFTLASSTLTASITPSATSSKVLILMSIGSYKKAGGAQYITIYRGSTDLGQGNNGIIGNNASNVTYSSAITLLDSPSTTSATTYQFRMRSESSGDSQRINNVGGVSSLVLLEVGA